MSTERVKPISPNEAITEQVFPDAVLESFNELIAQGGSRARGRDRITVHQNKVLARMVSKGLNREEIFDNGWLDVEGVYRKAGWQVQYDQPAWRDQDFEPYFTFSHRQRTEDI